MSVTCTLPAIFYFRVDTVSQGRMGNEIFLWFVLEFGRNVQRAFARGGGFSHVTISNIDLMTFSVL